MRQRSSAVTAAPPPAAAAAATHPSHTPRCGTCHSVYEPHTAKTTSCTVCTRFGTLTSNARKVRRDGHAPGLALELGDFAAWFTGQERRCAYCSIPEALVPELGLRTKVGLPLQRLGVDRVDNDAPYTQANMALACLPCNATKGKVFSAEEMHLLGAAISQVWAARLEHRGVLWTPTVSRETLAAVDAARRQATAARGPRGGDPPPGEPCHRCLAPYEPHTAKTQDCTVCVRFGNVAVNARTARRDGTTSGLELTRTEFAAWFMSQERSCAFCGIDEELVSRLGVRTKIDRPLARLGVDRIDNSRPYRPDNMVVACSPCNGTKSNVFTAEEMVHIAAAMRVVWSTRLALAGHC